MSWRNHDRVTSGGDAETSSVEGVDTEALETVRKESRQVLSEQLRLLNDIDDKAMRSVRTSVILLGLVVSAVQLGNSSLSVAKLGSWSFGFGMTGVCLLLLSVVTGVQTYSVSRPAFGVSDEHRADVVEGNYSEHEWLQFQLREYDQWIDSATQMNNKNAVLLHATLSSMVLGVLSLLVSVSASVGVRPKRALVSVGIAAALFTLVTILLNSETE
jgi:hypothetical protein